MVMVEINSNAILIEPMKSCKDAEMIWAYDALLQQLKRAGFQKYSSLTMKYPITRKNTSATHNRGNAAVVAKRNLKAHFLSLSILVGVSNTFHPQTGMTINLIPQSNATPNV